MGKLTLEISLRIKSKEQALTLTQMEISTVVNGEIIKFMVMALLLTLTAENM